jgi:dethiobiotin synthetase
VNGPRPEQLVVVVGTGTDVGKTWVSSALLAGCQASGLTVAARKPAQSFEPGDETTDADVLSSITGEDPKVICLPHRWYEKAFAPPMAADALGRPEIHHSDLLDELSWPFPRVSVGLVEMAGGVASPIAHDGHPVDFVYNLNPDHVILVADAGLGTISAIRTSMLSLGLGSGTDDGGKGHFVVVLNRFDESSELHNRNAEWLMMKDGMNLVSAPLGEMGEAALHMIGTMWPAYLPPELRN